MTKHEQALALMTERFGHDTLLSIATTDATRPFVRIVNSYYEDGSFYTVTYALSNKMKHIKKAPEVAVCGEWFTAHGIGENIGHPRDDKNKELMSKLRTVFAEWYDNGHTDETDPHTCILRIRLTDGELLDNGKKYKLKFMANKPAPADAFGTLPPFNEDALDEAQEIAFDAWEAQTRQKRQTLAKKALRISPYCTDAYNILASVSNDLDECVKLYLQGVDVGEKAFGKKYFKQNEGYFWGMTETRPYMRALEGLADSLWDKGDRQKSIDTYQKMLRLNPNDNQGVRYFLIHKLIAENAFEPAEKLLEKYPDDISAFMMYGAALLYFTQGRKVKARNALKKAIDANPHVPEFVLNPQKEYVPESEAERMFGGYQLGHASEANEYRTWSAEVWKEIPGAIEWLKDGKEKTK